ncbi:MAG TPA: alanine racemase [Limnobacter sp.]|uniref:alanine racemase n=1 Tax=Limnobacter sp. TaxID=2003368 RepID=UPI002E36BE3C|nr:alanine racemase [Limnobacter sp.]HEX5486415.1 alanine racemase [Limnobacter sp.]
MPRPIRAYIDPQAVSFNIENLKKRMPDATCMAVVKADGYGHGLSRIFKGLANADALALLELDRAGQLREMGWSKPILLLEGCFDKPDIEQALALRCDWVIHNQQQLAVLNSVLPLLRHAEFKPTFYLKLNTGMNRLGFDKGQTQAAIASLTDIVAAIGAPTPVMMTHFANADASDLQDTAVSPAHQHARLMDAKPPHWKACLGNSAAILNCPDLAGDIVRPGIAIYGASCGPHSAADYGLRAVMSLKSEVIAVQSVKKGQYAGYGSRWQARQDTVIGVIACGYADGYPRHAPDGTPVWVQGRRYPLAGRVSMDMMTVDLGPASEIKPGALVELWGSHLPVDEIASASGTIGYELLCAVTPRVPCLIGS